MMPPSLLLGCLDVGIVADEPLTQLLVCHRAAREICVDVNGHFDDVSQTFGVGDMAPILIRKNLDLFFELVDEILDVLVGKVAESCGDGVTVRQEFGNVSLKKFFA